MRNVTIAIVSTLFLFLSGIVIVNGQLAKQNNIHTVTAVSAAQVCTRSGQRVSGTEAALKPHQRVVMILQQGWRLILLILALSVTVGILIHRYKGKSTSIEDDLRKAILQGEIVPYYQPIVKGDTGGLYGVEVLARWKHPKSGFIPPDVFIPIAERSGLIIPLTKGLMAKVVTQLKPLLSKLPDGFHIGVNISARHIDAPSFIGDCRVFGKGFQGKEVKLVLEVTEREPLVDNPHLVENLNLLHKAGFVIALDDFGTGYSGLSCLNALAIDGNDSNLLIVFYVQIMPDDFVMQLHRF